MGAVSAGAGALGAITGAVQMISANKDKKRIAREIANQKEATLTNAADGMQVSTMGSDLQKQENARLAATQTSALQDGGTRALLGGLGRVTANNQDANAEIAANLDEQQKRIEDIGAQDNIRIQQTKEQRQNAKLAALSSQYNTAGQNAAQGMSNVISGAAMAGNAVSGMSDPNSASPITVNKKIKTTPTTSTQTRAAAYKQFGKGAQM